MQQTIKVLNPQLIQQYEEMGFTRLQIELAFQISLQKRKDLFDILVELSSAKQQEQDLNQIQSPRKNSNPDFQQDPRVRRQDCPTALKTTEHVKFFNCFLQVYFHIPKFVEYVFSFDQNMRHELQSPRLISSLKLMQELQTLFCLMIFSKKKDVDPSFIYSNIVDDMGNRVPSDRDTNIEEFIFCFLSRVEEALRYQNQTIPITQSAILQNHIDPSQDYSNDIMPSCIILSSGKQRQSDVFLCKDSQSSGPIQCLFIGRCIELNKDFSTQSIKIDKSFHIIPLSREFSDLYEAWQFQYHLDENPNETEIWIKQAPKLLVFQVLPFNQMVNFNFESHIFIDQFLLRNREQFKRNSKKLHRLKEKKAELEELLKHYENYNQSNASIPNILEMTIKILHNYGSELQQENESIDTILDTIIDCNQEVKKLKEEITLTSQAIDDLFTNMKEHRYDLHSIIINQGNLDTGNECIYVRNRTDKNIWMKFEENIIEQKQFDQILIEVMENQNTLYLTYIDTQFELQENSEYSPSYCHFDPLIQTTRQQDVNLLGLGPTSNKPYQFLVNDSLRRLAAEHNKQFEQELQNQIFQKQAELAVNNYSLRINHVQNFVNKYNNMQTNIPALHNFAIFLRSNDDMCDDLFKWQVFDCAIRDVTKQKLTLQDIKNIPSFAQKSSHLFLNMNPYKAPTTINVSQKDMHNINLKLSDYCANLQQARLLIYAIQCILELKWIQGLNALKFTLELNLGNYFHNLAQEIVKVVLLKLCNENYNLHSLQQYAQVESKYLWLDMGTLLINYRLLLVPSVSRNHSIINHQDESRVFKEGSKINNQKCNKKALNSDQQKIVKSYFKEIQVKAPKEIKGINYLLKKDDILDQIVYDLGVQSLDAYYWQIDAHNELSQDLANQVGLITSYFKSDVRFKNDIVKQRAIVEYEDRVRRNYHRAL